jgi:hypothetical protein
MPESYGVGPLAPGETKRQRLDALVAALKLERQSFEPVWRDCATYILPTRSRWQKSDQHNGRRRNQDIVDPTATLAAGTLKSGMHSGITSPARKWFGLGVADPQLADNRRVKDYLHDVREAILAVLMRSNLYQMLPVCYGDMGVFGLGALAVMEDEQDVIRAYDFPVGTFALGTDHTRRVSVFAHEHQMTVRQLVAQYGTPWVRGAPDWSRLSDRVKEAWERGRWDEWIDVVQVIQRNPDADPSRPLDQGAKPFVSCLYEEASREGARRDTEKFLEESGFEEFPILAGRWTVTGNDVYATDWPGYTAIGDIKELQLVRKKGARALDKVVDPPLQAPIAMQSQVVSTVPGTVTYTVGGPQQKVEPIYQIAPDLPALREWRDELRASIRRTFAEDLFLMLAQLERDVTATEIMARQQEKVRTLGPVLERLNDDVLEPLIDRVYGIMHRRGLLPEAPEELQGQALKVEYESEMSQALKQGNLGALERFAGNIATVIMPVAPSISDKVDWDQWADETATAMGLPARIVRSDEDVESLRAARAQEQQAAAAAERLPAVAGAAKQLSETRLGQDSALDALLSEGPAAMGAAA